MKKLFLLLFLFILFPVFSDSTVAIDFCKYFGFPKNTATNLQMITLIHNCKNYKKQLKIYSIENLKYKSKIDKDLVEYAKIKSIKLASELTIKEKISKLFIIPIEGKTVLSDDTKMRFNNIKPGGVLFVGTTDQMKLILKIGRAHV